MNSFVRIFVALCLSYSGYIVLNKLLKFTTFHSFAIVALFLLCVVFVSALYKSQSKSNEKEMFRKCVAKVDNRIKASKPFDYKIDRLIQEAIEDMDEGEARQEYLDLLYFLKEQYTKLMVNLPQGEKAVNVRIIALELVPAIYENYNLLSYPSQQSMQNSFVRHIRKIKEQVKTLSDSVQECD